MLAVLLAAGLTPAPHPVQARPDVYQLVVDCDGDFSGGACAADIGDLGPDTRNIISSNTLNGVRIRDGSPAHPAAAVRMR